MAGARGPMSFSLSTCHQGLKTAPEGDFFKSLTNFSTDLVDTMLNSKSQAPNYSRRILEFGDWSLPGTCSPQRIRPVGGDVGIWDLGFYAEACRCECFCAAM